MFDRCRAWRSLLTRRAEGVLSPSERALLDDHISKCAACCKTSEADEALRDLMFALDTTPAAGTARGFDDRVVTELRSLPVSDAPRGWRERVRACSTSLSFEFCMQLAGGGLAAAAVTAFVLLSALNPVQTEKSLSAYEVRTLSSAERNEPPVPLESLFQSPTPRAAMLWAAPGNARWRVRDEEPTVAPHVPAKPERPTTPRRHGARTVRHRAVSG